MLLSEACPAYMEAKSKKLRQTTLDGYVSGLRCHVLPMWGARDLESIRRREVQEWVDGAQRRVRRQRQIQVAAAVEQRDDACGLHPQLLERLMGRVGEFRRDMGYGRLVGGD